MKRIMPKYRMVMKKMLKKINFEIREPKMAFMGSRTVFKIVKFEFSEKNPFD